MSASRVRVTGPRLRSWEEVDDRLKSIGLLDIKLEGVEARLHRKVTELKEGAKVEAAPLEVERENLVRDVKEFVEVQAREGEFKAVRSKVLNFGAVGFRQSTRLVVKRMAETLKRLREQGMKDCIRVKEEVDKEVLRGYGDQLLEAVGVSRKVEDAFFMEVDRERVHATVVS